MQLLKIFLWISSEKNEGGWLVVDAVAVAGRLAGDEDADGGGAAVDGLMRLAGGDLDSLPCLEGEVVVFDLDG